MLKITTIEMLDLTKIKEEDNEYSLRDHQNYPVFPYRYFKFCIGVNNFDELKDIANQIKIEKKYFFLNYLIITINL